MLVTDILAYTMLAIIIVGALLGLFAIFIIGIKFSMYLKEDDERYEKIIKSFE